MEFDDETKRFEANLMKELSKYYPQLFESKTVGNEAVLAANIKVINEHLKQAGILFKEFSAELDKLGKSGGVNLLKVSKEFKEGLAEVLKTFNILERQVQSTGDKLQNVLVKSVNNFTRELRGALGVLFDIGSAIGGTIGGAIGKLKDKFEDVLKSDTALGALGRGGVSMIDKLGAVLPWIGGLVAIVVAASVETERLYVAGRRVTNVLENIKMGITGIGAGFGIVLKDMAAEWGLSSEVLARNAGLMLSALGVSLVESGRLIKQNTETMLKDITEMGLAISARFGISIEEVAKKINDLGLAWGRMGNQKEIVSRWFETLNALAKNTGLTTTEFAGMVDKLRGQLGLLGLTMDNSVKVAYLMNRVFKDGRDIFKDFGLGAEGSIRMFNELGNFENKLKGNLGSFLYFSGALGGGFSNLGDLWKKWVGASESYRKGGAFGLVMNFYDMMLEIMGGNVNAAKAGVAIQMGLSPELAGVFNRFMDLFLKSMGDVKDVETRQLLLQYLKKGGKDDRLLEELQRRGVKVDKMEELIKTYKEVAKETTDPLTRIKRILEDMVAHLTMAIMSIIVILVGGFMFLAGAIKSIWGKDTGNWEEKGKKLFTKGISGFMEHFKNMLTALGGIGGELVRGLADSLDIDIDNKSSANMQGRVEDGGWYRQDEVVKQNFKRLFNKIFKKEDIGLTDKDIETVRRTLKQASSVLGTLSGMQERGVADDVIGDWVGKFSRDLGKHLTVMLDVKKKELINRKEFYENLGLFAGGYRQTPMAIYTEDKGKIIKVDESKVLELFKTGNIESVSGLRLHETEAWTANDEIVLRVTLPGGLIRQYLFSRMNTSSVTK
jgi:hypothetical protein